MENENQKKAINSIDKSSIIIAGPGSGKTFVISCKVKKLTENNFKKEEVLCLTFSNKSCFEMSERITKNLNEEFVSFTFHSFCLEIINSYEKHITNISSNFEFIDDNFILMFFWENFDSFNFKSIEIKEWTKKKICQDIYSKISSLKEKNMNILDIEKLDININLKLDLIVAYSKYEKYKLDNNLIDFSDMLTLTYNLLKNNKKIRDKIRNKYKYILVDEFQDTNKIQLEIIKLLLNEDKNNLTIVLDNKQSIYSFRGAEYKNLENLKTHLKNYEEIYLTENYRNSKEIVKNLNELILKNFNEKELIISSTKNTGSFNIRILENELFQNQYIEYLVLDFLEKNETENEKSLAILTRTNSEAKEIYNFLKLAGIDCNFSNKSNIFENPIVNLIFSIIKIIQNSKENNLEFFLIFEYFDLSNLAIKEIFKLSHKNEYSVLKVLENENFVSKKENRESIFFESDVLAIKKIKYLIIELINLSKLNCNISLLIVSICERFEFLKNAKILKNDNLQFLIKKIINLSFTFTKIHKSNDLKKFLLFFESKLDIYFEDINSKNKINSKINIMTIHNSKGLEFDCVLIPNLINKLYPLNIKENQFDFQIKKNDENTKEEIRLFFVAISRAKENVYLITYEKNNKNTFVKKSEFLDFFSCEKKMINLTEKNIKQNSEIEIKRMITTQILKSLTLNNIENVKSEISNYENLFLKKSNLECFENENFKKYSSILKNQKKSKIEFINNVEEVVYSHSRISNYSQCPKKYLYGYEYSLPTQNKYYFSFGTSIHTVLEILLKNYNWEKYSKEELISLGMEILFDNWLTKGYENLKEEEKYKKEGIKIVEKFINTQLELNKIQTPISFEDSFQITINGKKIKGFIDRIDKNKNGDLIILDYKTSKKIKTQNELDKDQQLYVYAKACFNLYGKYPKKMGLWFVKFDKIVETTFNIKIMEKFEKDLTYEIEKIEKKDFTPKPTWFNCQFCDYNKICDSNFLKK
jgi:DNA helicase-2/ATP-dependent DNA helicase PcrA